MLLGWWLSCIYLLQFQLVYGGRYVGTTLYSSEITKREIRQQIVFLIKIIDGHYQFTREEQANSSLGPRSP